MKSIEHYDRLKREGEMSEYGTIYTLSDDTVAWLKHQEELATHPMMSGRRMAKEDPSYHHVLWEGLYASMPNGYEARFVASIQGKVGDWAVYFGAGGMFYVLAYGAKQEERIARFLFPDVPADLVYRP
jgi:hypothetical protein